MRKGLYWGWLLLLLGALGACRKAASTSDFVSVAVEERSLKPKKRFLARFEPEKTRMVHSQADGRVLRILVEEEQRLEEGQIVVELDKRQVDRALKEVDSDEVIQGLKWLRSACDIRSPISGKVLSIHVRSGQNVGGVWGALPTTNIITVMPDSGELLLKALVSFEDAELLKEGTEVVLEAPGAIEGTKGTVLNQVPGKKYVAVQFTWEGDLPWSPEVYQLVKVDLLLPETKPGPSLPLEALERREEEWFVRLSRGGDVVEQSVLLGMDDDRWVQILEGVSCGDTVLLRKQ